MSHHDLLQQRASIRLTRPTAIQAMDIHLITVIRRLSAWVLALRSDIEDGETELGVMAGDGVIEVVGGIAGVGDLEVAGGMVAAIEAVGDIVVAGDIMAAIEALGDIVVAGDMVAAMEEAVGDIDIANLY